MDFTASIEREEGKYEGREEREIMRNFKDKIINNEEKDCQNWKIEGEKQKIVTTGKMKKKSGLILEEEERLQQTMWSQAETQERQHRK